MTRSFRNVFTAIILCVLFISVRGVSAEPGEAPAAQTVAPFLYPPYPGSASQESIFDHTSPNYTIDDRVVAYTGDVANKNCPVPAPAGTPPPQAGVCNAGGGGYWSYSLGNWLWYDGHDGVDYGISYRPVYAAADADQIVYAGWWDPQNHRVSLGIYVRLHHSNGYNTYYGHMSSVAVQQCSTIGCASVPHGEFLGISGTTGNSSGPHLHFTLRSPANRSVDPYGWRGSGADPWVNNQRESLWVAYPALQYYGARVYPSGPTLPYPPAPATGLLIDDGGANYSETPLECWNDIVNNGSTGGIIRYSRARTTAPTCTAQWFLPAGANDGFYSLYVRIPPVRATTQGAVYTISHAGELDTVVVNQAVFPNIYYVTDGWLYIGKYNFDGDGNEYIQLTNRTQDESATVSELFVGADAVRFVFQGDTPPTPLTPVTATSTQTPSITPSPTITRTPTITYTPSKTPTPTVTRTPTSTRTPTLTRTPTPTRTPTFTRTPSRTPTATRTFTPSRTPTATRTPTVTRTPTSTRTPTFTRTPTPTRTPTFTRTPSRTPTISRTPTPTRTTPPTATRTFTLIDVYFANRFRYENNLPPIEVTGDRWARTSMLPQSALNEYFKGPGSTELYSYGWIAIYNGFTGYSNLEVTNGVAHVYLTGTCTSDGRDFNIADLLRLNLKQFPEIRFVKIYDQNGQTQTPTGQSDSEPICLAHFFSPTPSPTRTPTPTRTATFTRTPTRTPTSTRTPTATRTPTITRTPTFTRTPTLTRTPTRTRTPTPTRTLTRTPTSTRTRVPTATPQYTLVNVYFVSKFRYENNLPPFERAGRRWVRSNDIIGGVLDEYFEGPGSTELYSFGWIAIYDGFTGYSRVEVANGIARVYLTGTCAPASSSYNIGDILIYNLKQFDEIQYVKIYDENGITNDPFGLNDSVPPCLE